MFLKKIVFLIAVFFVLALKANDTLKKSRFYAGIIFAPLNFDGNEWEYQHFGRVFAFSYKIGMIGKYRVDNHSLFSSGIILNTMKEKYILEDVFQTNQAELISYNCQIPLFYEYIFSKKNFSPLFTTGINLSNILVEKTIFNTLIKSTNVKTSNRFVDYYNFNKDGFGFLSIVPSIGAGLNYNAKKMQLQIIPFADVFQFAEDLADLDLDFYMFRFGTNINLCYKF